MGQIGFQTRSIEFEVVRLDRFCRPIDLGHGLLLGWARWARQARQAGPVEPVGPDVGAVGQSCCMRFLEGDLVGILSRSSQIPDFVEVLARRNCGYPSEILCCRGVCEEILRTSCWNLLLLQDICVKI